MTPLATPTHCYLIRGREGRMGKEWREGGKKVEREGGREGGRAERERMRERENERERMRERERE
jgi:hypothetical protein